MFVWTFHIHINIWNERKVGIPHTFRITQKINRRAMIHFLNAKNFISVEGVAHFMRNDHKIEGVHYSYKN